MFVSNNDISPLALDDSTVTPTIANRRRSKSLDDLTSNKEKDRLSCYQDAFAPRSPIVTFNTIKSLPKRRHSLCAEPSNIEYIRLATIYGWIYTANKNSKHELSSNRRLQTSRSFSHIPCTTSNKFTRMFGRKTLNTATSLTSIFPIIDKKEEEEEDPLLLPWMNTAKKDERNSLLLLCEELKQITLKPPPKPIENNPHVFDLLSKNSSLFIHYGKCDNTTITSATVEKLIEKLTLEMDNDFLMDFFLTFRQFTTPIKLCKLLILRFRWALIEENDQRRLVRIRTFVVIRHWLTHYWTYDFMISKTLRFMLSTFLTQLQTHPVILSSPRDERIIKNLRNVLKRQRKFYNDINEKELEQQHATSRKDSAIGISSCRHSTQHSENNDSSSWRSKVKRSLRRSNHSGVCSCSKNSLSSMATNNCSIHSATSIEHHQHKVLSSYIPNSIHSTPYKSFILKYRSEIIAQQFCIIERNMLQKVTWDELVELRWRKRSSQRQSFVIDLTNPIEGEDTIGVDKLIGFFNMTCQWVASEVVRSNGMETRIKVIEKLIRIALKCFQHRNYSTLMQILLGLQSPAVSRLEKTWQKVDHCQIELFNQLKEMAKPFRNWKNVRDCMTKATEEVAESFAVESILTDSLKGVDHTTNGCIPFLGLYLSDLVFIAELPTFIESSTIDTTDDEEEESSKEDKELYERLSHHQLVNYNKFRITASVVKHVLAFQVLSKAYKFKIQNNLYSQLQSMSLLDNSQIRKASFLCEE